MSSNKVLAMQAIKSTLSPTYTNCIIYPNDYVTGDITTPLVIIEENVKDSKSITRKSYGIIHENTSFIISYLTGDGKPSAYPSTKSASLETTTQDLPVTIAALLTADLNLGGNGQLMQSSVGGELVLFTYQYAWYEWNAKPYWALIITLPVRMQSVVTMTA